MVRFSNIEHVGEGQFGSVSRAYDSKFEQVVAMKRITIPVLSEFPKMLLREIHTLKAVQHMNVIDVFDVFVDNNDLIIVTEYVPHTLAELLTPFSAPLSLGMVKSIAFQLTCALVMCHMTGVMHRDVKPGNVLITKDGTVKLADFGMSRVHPDWHLATDDERPLSNVGATRWYRAPEVLWGSIEYDFKVDTWGLGVVIAEMLCGSPLFSGDTDIDQLHRVIEVLGTPSEVNDLPDYDKITFSNEQSTLLSDFLPPYTPPDLLDLLQNLICYPSQRMSAFDALNHPFFSNTIQFERVDHRIHESSAKTEPDHSQIMARIAKMAL
ncbi:hypothetical protein PCE1_003982 [Barthelona sp. PCE]